MKPDKMASILSSSSFIILHRVSCSNLSDAHTQSFIPKNNVCNGNDDNDVVDEDDDAGFIQVHKSLKILPLKLLGVGGGGWVVRVLGCFIINGLNII